jgi:SAM-dependent methyltransferase
MKCRHCAQALEHPFLDLGHAPPSNAYVAPAALNAPETYYPLRLQVCANCWLVQTEDYAAAEELFSPDYAYFSSVSQGWLDHAARHSASMIERQKLSPRSFVIEVASNDGYLLRNFVAAGIPCLGIEPTASTAAAAEKIGVPTLRQYFGAALGAELASSGRAADVIFGNNVYAHVPDINDFTRALRAALKPGGTISLEFPHLLRLMLETQFDTVYHEHFSYLSLTAVARIFQAAGLRVFDVDEIDTHGGSLRIYGCHSEDARANTPAVARILADEKNAGLTDLATYRAFQRRADAVKNALVAFLIEQKRAGKHVAAYGAAAKGNTLLNYGGVKPDLLSFVCDAAPSKQGKFLPGCHVPILAPAALRERKPDVVLILPWNIAGEVARQHAYIKEWGGRFVVAVPELRFLEA